MDRLNIPRGQFRDLGISPTHCNKIRRRVVFPSPGLILKIHELNPEIKIADILTPDNPILKICELYRQESTL